MANLKAMFGPKPTQPEGKTDAVPPSEAATTTPDSGMEAAATAGEGKPEAPATVPPVRANPFARKAATTAAPESPEHPAPADSSVVPDGAKATPKLAGFKVPGSATAVAKPAPAPTPTADTSLDDLANLDISDIAEEGARATRSGFADETPATKPTRELPEGLEKQQLQFVDLLDGMYEIVHDPELLGNVVKSMMIELKANPQYEKLLSPSDVRLVVKASREAMGIARVKKQESKARRSGGGKAKANVDTDMLADLDDLGISFD